MNSVNDLKNRIDGLNSHDLRLLEKWLNQHAEWKIGKLKDCFVIMPFSMTRDGRSKDYWTNFFEGFLTTSLALCGYRAVRSQGTGENIVAGIMEDLAWSGLVIAVLTDFNPNVWYELGVRHSLRRGSTVMICQEDQISSLPFDLKHHGVVSYTASLDHEKFALKVAPFLAKTDGTTKDSPVCDFTNSGTTYCIQRALAERREVLRAISHCDETDALNIIDRLNEEWKDKNLQITVVKDGRLFRHQGGAPIGMPAEQCFEDAVSENASQYQTMKTYGEGLWFGSIKGHRGRLTAIAYTTLDQRGWLLAIESHIRQSQL
jgi:hypothetical protein